MEDVFAELYASQAWEKGSGPGSYPEITPPYRSFLQHFIKWNNIESVVDLGCGDWQISELMDWSGIDYTGIDCVNHLIERNQELFGSSNIRFVHQDIAANPILPAADLAIVKDVFQHWKYEQIHQFLPALQKYRYVLFTNCRTQSNVELSYLGLFRPLNMALPPLSLPVATVLDWDTKLTQLWIPQENASGPLPDYQYLKDLLLPIDYPGLKRFGSNEDGGYILSKDLTKHAPIVYSYGVGSKIEEFSFDIEMAQIGKTIFMYDGSVEGPPVTSSRFFFKREHVNSYNIGSHIYENGHLHHSNMILKMDIEGNEYATLVDCPESVFNHFSQIAIEVHDLIIEGHHLTELSAINKSNHSLKKAFFSRLLHHYHLAHIHANNYSGVARGMADVLELLFIRKDCSSSVEPLRVACPRPGLDAPNDSKSPDITLDWWVKAC